jgi:hypothetical protein
MQWASNAYSYGKTEAMLDQHGTDVAILQKPLVIAGKR